MLEVGDSTVKRKNFILSWNSQKNVRSDKSYEENKAKSQRASCAQGRSGIT